MGRGVSNGRRPWFEGVHEQGGRGERGEEGERAGSPCRFTFTFITVHVSLNSSVFFFPSRSPHTAGKKARVKPSLRPTRGSEGLDMIG